MEIECLDDWLPWRHPFRMIDRMIECVPHEHIHTVKVVSANDPLVHHPTGEAGTLSQAMVLEGLSQSAALLYQLTYGKVDGVRLPLLGYLQADFTVPASADDRVPTGTAAVSDMTLAHRPGVAAGVAAGEQIMFEVHAVKMTPTHGLFEGTARVGKQIVVRAELAFAVADPGGVQ